MSKTVEYLTKEPECIFVVSWENKHRIYIREGQALNWFSKKVLEGKKVKILKYTNQEGFEG